MYVVTIQDIMNLGNADVGGIMLGVRSDCVEVGNIVTGARGVWFCVCCKFGLDAAG